jgi:hypothetical protein
MQSSSNFSKPWIYTSKQWFQALLIVGFLLWTSILTIETVNVQNSCHPMFDWDRKLAESCPPISKPVDNPVHKSVTKPIVEQCHDNCNDDPELKIDPATVGVVVGGVGAVIAAIAGAPVFVTVGIMIFVGIVATSVLALAK